MSLLFLFLEPDRPHGTLLAGYFSKVFVNFSQISDNTTLMNIMIGYFICAWLVDLLIGLKLPYSQWSLQHHPFLWIIYLKSGSEDDLLNLSLYAAFVFLAKLEEFNQILKLPVQSWIL
jgi:hypothetical protein